MFVVLICLFHCLVQSANAFQPLQRIRGSRRVNHADSSLIGTSCRIGAVGKGTVDDSGSEGGRKVASKENKANKKQSKKSNKKQKKWQTSKKKKNNYKNNNSSGNVNRILNQQIVQAPSADDLLLVIQQQPKCLTQLAGGHVLNSVNFSTAMHRLARHSIQGRESAAARASILADARFALFLACLAEALDSTASNDGNGIQFQSREVSNIGWALAKLKLPPPLQAMPPATANGQDNTSLKQAAALVRKAVLDYAAQRRESSGNSNSSPTWIPALSQLAGRILDAIGQQMLSPPANGSSRSFQMQEYANLLWAWATAGRAQEPVVHHVLQSMMEKQKTLLMQKNEFSDKEDVLRPQEWSNSLWSIAKAAPDIMTTANRGDATPRHFEETYVELIEFVAHLLNEHNEQDAFSKRFKPQEMSNSLWGVATLISLNSKQRLLSDTADSDKDNTDDTATLRAREAAAALTILRCFCRYVQTTGAASSFKSQEVSNSVWSMATLGFGLQGSTSSDGNGNTNANNYVVLPSNQSEDDAQLMEATIQTLIQSATPLLPRFRSQELNNFSWSMARLLEKKHLETMPGLHRFLGGIAHQLTYPQRPVTSQDIGTTLWALATLEFPDTNDLYRKVAARLQTDKSHLYKPQELSNVVWSLAKAEVQLYEDIDAFDTSLVVDRPPVRDPVMLCFAIAGRELTQRPHQFKSQEIKDVLWSYSKAGIRHPRLFRWTTQHLLGEDSDRNCGRLDEFSPQGLGNLCWAYARQAQLAAETSSRLKGSSTLANANGRLAVYTTSYFDIGELLLQRFFAAIAETDLRVHKEMVRCKPQDLANSAWAFAVLGLKDASFLQAIKSELVGRTQRFVRGDMSVMTQFKGQEVANQLWALATLNVPAIDILQVIAPYIRAMVGNDGKSPVTAADIAKVFKRQELANICWSCAVFDEYPPDLMELLYTGLFGSGKDQDSSYMSKIHSDQGLQSQAIMTMIYVQISLQLSGSNQKASLPVNFPEGWTQLSPSPNSDTLTETTFDELNLSTSKIQRSVASAFSRVGFEHVEEHVITMSEMANDHGINIAPKPVEILSIDIANVEDKIAIEVDGPAHYISRIDQPINPNAKDGYSKVINGKLEYQFVWNGDRQEINGPTALKHRLLRSLGWKVIPLPFWEWYRLEGNEEAENQYCQKLLAH